MKIKNYFLATLLITLMFGCGKENVSTNVTKKNMFNHDNKDYELSNAYLENWGLNGGKYDINLSLVSSGVKIIEKNGEIESASGIGHAIIFEIISKTKILAVGEYRFDEDNDVPNTFGYSSFGFDYNFDLEKGASLKITGGSVNVIKSGSEYELTFDLVAQDGKKVTGYFKGIPKVYGSSPMDDIFLRKQGFSMRNRSSIETK